MDYVHRTSKGNQKEGASKQYINSFSTAGIWDEKVTLCLGYINLAIGLLLKLSLQIP